MVAFNKTIEIVSALGDWLGAKTSVVERISRTRSPHAPGRSPPKRPRLHLCCRVFCAAERASGGGAGFSSTLILSNWDGIIFSLIVGRVGDSAYCFE